MNANYSGLLSATILVITLLGAPCTHAGVLDAINFSRGTDISNAFSGATLEYLSYEGPSSGQTSGFTKSPLVVGTDTVLDQPAPPLFNTLGPATNGSDCFPPFGQDCAGWNAIYGVFTRPVYTISTTSVDDDGDYVFLSAFDTSGNLIGYTFPTETCKPFPKAYEDRTGCNGVWQMNSFSSTIPIGSFLLGSYSQAAYVTEIDIPGLPLPEPSSLALFGCGLLGLGIAILRRRQHF